MVRSFTGRPVPGPVLDGLLAAALRSPSAGNAGGYALVVLEGTDQTAPLWAATTDEDWRSQSRRWPGLRRAPVVVVVLTDPGVYVDRYREADKSGSGLGDVGPEGWPVPYWFVDAGMAIMTLLLGAVDAGLGACFLGSFRGEEALLRHLGVPSGWRHVGSVVLGEAGGGDPPSPSLRRGRRGPDAVHRGRW